MSPRPSRGETKIRFNLARPGEVAIEIIDAAGRRVRAFRKSAAVAGTNELLWDGKDDGGRAVRSEIYFVRLHAGGRTETARAVVLD